MTRRRRPTVAERRRNARIWRFIARASIAVAGPACVYSYVTRGASTTTLWVGVGLTLITLLSSYIIRRIVIVWLSCIGLYAIRWLITRAVYFPQGPGRIDDPKAPWRVWLGVKE